MEQLHKPNISTEFCASLEAIKDPVKLAECCGKEICENLNNYCIGICDWNVLLDETGGPYHNRGKADTDTIDLVYADGSAGCCAPVPYDKKQEKIQRTLMY